MALAQLLEHLPTDHLHGPAATQVTVLMVLETLRGHLTVAGLDTDRTISAGEARRQACDVGSVGIVGSVLGRGLGGRSLVLDLGRSSRLFTEAQRTAVHALHAHCATRGCSRPVAWCELHHRVPWSHGGRTDLDNAVPLRGWHHGRVHDHRYLAGRNTDGTLTLTLTLRPQRGGRCVPTPRAVETDPHGELWLTGPRPCLRTGRSAAVDTLDR